MQKMTNRVFQSFSKRLSRRLLIVFVLAITVISALVVTLATVGMKTMTDAYFYSQLEEINEMIRTLQIVGESNDQIYERMKKADVRINKFYPIVPEDANEKDYKNIWAYSLVIDSAGHYIYHPEKQRIHQGNFFDDIRQSPQGLINQLTQGLSSGKKGHQRIKIDGMRTYIFYSKVKGTNCSNAIIVPIRGLQIPTYLSGLLLLAVIGIALTVAYWVSRITIRRSTQPLHLLAQSADEVAKGNFQNPLPDLQYNDEISQLRDSFGNMQHSLTLYIDELKTTTAQKAAIESELNAAHKIQMSMLPTELPNRDDIDIYGSMIPARNAGGDLYDYFITPDSPPVLGGERGGRLYFCIGDVSGKGVPAALFMVKAKSLFRVHAKGEDNPDRIVSRMNLDLCENNDDCMFVTLFVGILDLQSGLLRYCNAGHEPPVLINQSVQQLPVDFGYPVGAFEDTLYLTQEIVIEPQTAILLYTDGMNEAVKNNVEDGSKELFSDQRILDVADVAIQEGQLSPKAIIENMTQAVHDFVGDTEQSDDLTMLCIRLI